jgi:hypothetical protein
MFPVVTVFASVIFGSNNKRTPKDLQVFVPKKGVTSTCQKKMCLVDTQHRACSGPALPPKFNETNVRKRVIVERAAGHPSLLLDACAKNTDAIISISGHTCHRSCSPLCSRPPPAICSSRHYLASSPLHSHRTTPHSTPFQNTRESDVRSTDPLWLK